MHVRRMDLLLINQSTLLSKGDVELLAAACGGFLAHHVAPAWGLTTPALHVASEGFGYPECVLLDDAEQAGQLGYHSVSPEGRPYARVFVRPLLSRGGSKFRGVDSVSVTTTHELAELLIDPFINQWVDIGESWLDANGQPAEHAVQFVAKEVCDPVENECFEIPISGGLVSVSNFVLPDWFNPNAVWARYDCIGTRFAPFSVSPTGYVITRNEAGKNLLTGDQFTGQQLAAKLHPASRTFKRFQEV